MPNWCWNQLDVFADDENGKEKLRDLEEAVRGAEEEPFSIESYYPTPAEGEIAEDDFTPFANRVFEDMPKWYRWRLSCWGTKWDVDNSVSVFRHEDELVYSFYTAWSPPIAAITKLSELYPDLRLTLEFDEPGNDFWGLYEWNNGELIEVEEGESRAALEDYTEDLPD